MCNTHAVIGQDNAMKWMLRQRNDKIENTVSHGDKLEIGLGRERERVSHAEARIAMP